MKMLYIAGKYRSNSIDGVKENVRVARRYAEKYWKLGYAVICPHTNSGTMEYDVSEQLLMDGDLEFIKRCDVIVMLPGWIESAGSRAEHELAIQCKLQIIYEYTAEQADFIVVSGINPLYHHGVKL
jgi:hypothetical protein